MLGSFSFLCYSLYLEFIQLWRNWVLYLFAHLYVFRLFFILFLAGACALMLIKGVYWSEYLGLGFFSIEQKLV